MMSAVNDLLKEDGRRAQAACDVDDQTMRFLSAGLGTFYDCLDTGVGRAVSFPSQG